MPTQWQTFPIKLEGGLTTNLGRIEQGIQAPGSATILQNFEADIQGGYTRILGYRKYSDTAVTGTGQVLGVVALNEAEVLAVRDGNYHYSSGTTWASKLALTNPSITRINHDSYNFSGVRKTVIVDGVNAPAYFDHTTKTMAYAVGAPTEVSGAFRVKVFKSHIFFAKGRFLSFTAPYGESDFSIANGAGTINVGDDITGLTIFRDQLIVFCLNSIYRVNGNTVSDFTLSVVTNQTGCLSGDTVQEVGGDIMYLGPDGIRYLSASERENDFGLTRASQKVQSKILENLSATTQYSSITIAQKNQYRLFVYKSNVAQANSVGFIAAKFSNQTADDISWSTTKGIKVYGVSKFQSVDNEYVVFCSDTGFIYSMESGSSFDGSDIESIFETPYMPISDPKLRKTFYKHTLYARPSGSFSLMANLKFDYGQPNSSPASPFNIVGDSGSSVYGDASTVYGTAVYGSRAEEQYYNNVLGSGFVVAIRYSDISQRPSFNLNFVVLEYRQNERR